MYGDIRAVLIGEKQEPYFVGKDVAQALGYSDLTHCITDHVDEEDRVNSKTQGHFNPEFGQRGTWLINESGLYSLILSSKLPSAKEFKRWVTSEILPSIRKHRAFGQHCQNENVDFVDLTQRVGEVGTLDLLLNLGYSKSAITQAKNRIISINQTVLYLISHYPNSGDWF